jgi:hypothetical protein
VRFLILILAAGLAHAQRVPVLAELFTSEGCSSCPPADQLLQTFDRLQPVDGARIIVLSEHVDYWDRQGWRDPFSQPLFTSRQQQYASALSSEVYTPQLVVDGREQVLGNDRAAAQKAIAQAASKPKSPMEVTAVRDGDSAVVTVRFDKPLDGRNELWVAIADESARSSVTRGENSGRELTHIAIVRKLQSAGKVKGTERTLHVRVAPGQSRVIAFLTGGGGAVTGAGMATLP